MITEETISQLHGIADFAEANHGSKVESSIVRAAACVLESGGGEFDAEALRILWAGKKAVGGLAAFIQQATDLLIEAASMAPLKVVVEARDGLVEGVYLSESIPHVKVDIVDWNDDESQINETAICARRDKMTKVF